MDFENSFNFPYSKILIGGISDEPYGVGARKSTNLMNLIKRTLKGNHKEDNNIFNKDLSKLNAR